MRKHFFRFGVALIVAFILRPSPTRGADAAMSDEELVKRVSKLLLSVTDPPTDMPWPPKISIKNNDDINAYATMELESIDDNGKPKVRPIVVVFSGLMKKVVLTKDDPDPNSAPDRLAYVMGHEISHLLLKHVVLKPEDFKKTEFVRKAFGREQEIAADLKGAELCLKAGFSHRKGMDAIVRMNKLGLRYSSFEGLSVGHPSWDDRITLLDQKRSQLWRSMSAFYTGSSFLLLEQYPAAETCFRRVIDEFPQCDEAWANLGYALLMQYCDGLEAEDLRQLKVGQILVGGFYRRPESLESMVRGMDQKVWKEAVTALEKANELKEGQLIVQANLGIAYLVHPSGKPALAKAQKYLEAAAKKAADDDKLDPALRSAILVNAGVADLAAGRVEEGEKSLTKGDKAGSKYVAGFVRVSSVPGLTTAVTYNRAMLLAGSKEEAKKTQAIDQFETYLKSASPASAWWPIAYDRYTALCKDLKRKPRDRDNLVALAPSRLRLVTAVKVGETTVALTQPLQVAASKLGEETPAAARSKLKRVRFAKYDMEVLATDTILAICLTGANAPSIPVQPAGGGPAVGQLKVGMDDEKCADLLAEEPFDLRNLDDPGVSYRFYSRLGLGVRVKDKKVVEIVVAQIPRKPRLLDE
jgi:tetratricopeptide (TPR) repeat protein